jgi:DNA transposition AAA+ family ATPase
VIEEKISSFLEREEQCRAEVVIPIVETTTVENVSRAVEMAHICKDITVVTGDAGTGKTTAVRWYTEGSRAEFTVYIYQDLTQYQLVIEIARVVGVSQKGSKFAIEKAVDNYLDYHLNELAGKPQ